MTVVSARHCFLSAAQSATLWKLHTITGHAELLSASATAEIPSVA